jgi:hypothetical protein
LLLQFFGRGWVRPCAIQVIPAQFYISRERSRRSKTPLRAGREVLIYFRQGPPPMPDDDLVAEALAQRSKVRTFRARLEQQGRGVNEYRDTEDFKCKLEQHLDQLLTRIRDASLDPAGHVTIKKEELFELKDLLRDVEIPDASVDTLFHQTLPDSRDFDVISDQSHFFVAWIFWQRRGIRPLIMHRSWNFLNTVGI